MIKSMTAYSQAQHTCEQITADITIRSYNSRHLDLAFYSPDFCQMLEEKVKKIIARTHSRGRIEVRLNLSDSAPDQALFEVDDARAASFFKALEKINTDLDLSGPVTLSHILAGKQMIVPLKAEKDMDKIWSAVAPAIESASVSLDRMRKEEGENLFTDLSSRMDYIEAQLAAVEKDAKEIPVIYKKRLMDRISSLASDTDTLDPVRLNQEAAILADKSDVSEEIVRLYSHIKMFREILNNGQSQGRKLNFIIQEFNREFNTIGSKAGKASLSHRVVDLKSELEKIREQVQNVE